MYAISVHRRVPLTLTEYRDSGFQSRLVYLDVNLRSFAIVLGFDPDFLGLVKVLQGVFAATTLDAFRYLDIA